MTEENKTFYFIIGVLLIGIGFSDLFSAWKYTLTLVCIVVGCIFLAVGARKRDDNEELKKQTATIIKEQLSKKRQRR